MTKNIPTQDITRMFPFAFYDEISERLNGYVLQNPAFMLRDQLPADKREQLFIDTQDIVINQQLRDYNIVSIEPFGEVLLLELCCSTEHAQLILNGRDAAARSQIPLSILIVQLYDSSDAPVFAADVTQDTIAKIPEVLWDDPNLFIGIITFTEAESQVGIIRIPERIEAKLFESLDQTDDSADATHPSQ